MSILSAFLSDRSEVLTDLAVMAVVRSASTRTLAAALAVTGAEIGDLSASQVADGVTRLVASGALDAAE